MLHCYLVLYKLKLKTKEEKNGYISQTIIFSNADVWFDWQLRLNLIRKEFQNKIILKEHKLLNIVNCGRYVIILYKKNDGVPVSINKYDGVYRIKYSKPVKTCSNCVSFDVNNRKCLVMDKDILIKYRYCDLFLEKA